MLKSVLIANRGEIACRVIRTARRLGPAHDRRLLRGRSRGAARAPRGRGGVHRARRGARELPRRVERILEAAREQTRAESIHPGYGFLSENAAFARGLSRGAGIVFIGPPPEAIVRMGSKSEARRLMAAAGVPVLPGYDGDDQSDASAARGGGQAARLSRC